MTSCHGSLALKNHGQPQNHQMCIIAAAHVQCAKEENERRRILYYACNIRNLFALPSPSIPSSNSAHRLFRSLAATILRTDFRCSAESWFRLAPSRFLIATTIHATRPPKLTGKTLSQGRTNEPVASRDARRTWRLPGPHRRTHLPTFGRSTLAHSSARRGRKRFNLPHDMHREPKGRSETHASTHASRTGRSSASQQARPHAPPASGFAAVPRPWRRRRRRRQNSAAESTYPRAKRENPPSEPTLYCIVQYSAMVSGLIDHLTVITHRRTVLVLSEVASTLGTGNFDCLQTRTFKHVRFSRHRIIVSSFFSYSAFLLCPDFTAGS